MKISQIIVKESSAGTSTAGSVATVAKPLGEVNKRESTKVDGLEPAGKVMKAKKKGPYMNSLIEGKMKDLEMDLKDLKDSEFKKKYSKSKQEMRDGLKNKPTKKVDEAKLDEEDVILVPGQGRKLKTGFVKHDPDKAEKEGQTIKNSLHTIIRIAKALDRDLSTKDNFPEWASEKIGTIKSMMTSVADYVISSKEMQHDPDAMQEMTGGVLAGGLQYENVENNQEELEKNLRYSRSRAPVADAIRKKLNPNQKPKNEGAKVDRMVKHIASSEKKLGKGKKEAENIAWATANKRGYLNNKNHVKGK